MLMLKMLKMSGFDAFPRLDKGVLHELMGRDALDGHLRSVWHPHEEGVSGARRLRAWRQ